MAAAKRGTGSLRFQKKLGIRTTTTALRILPLQARQHSAEQPQQSQIQAFHRGLAANADRPRQLAGSAHRPQPRLETTMANILYLVHRLPYPPNKGDKVRSYNLFKHLLKQHRVFLGTFIDDPEDESAHCHFARHVYRSPRQPNSPRSLAKIRSLNGLLTDEPLTLRYYRDASLKNVGIQHVASSTKSMSAVIFSSAMAQYVEDNMPRLTTVIDFVDVDSAKWTQYAPQVIAGQCPGSIGVKVQAAARIRAKNGRPGRPLVFRHRSRSRPLHLQLKHQNVAFASRPCAMASTQTIFRPIHSVRHPSRLTSQSCRALLPITGKYQSFSPVPWITGPMSMPSPGLLQRSSARPAAASAGSPVLHRRPQPDTLKFRRWPAISIVVTGTVPDVRPYLQHAGCRRCAATPCPWYPEQDS
jgi:hypothetical protein